MKQLLINCEGLETRVAVVEDGALQDYFIERKDEHHIVGSIFKGVIRNLEPSLQAAFVDIGADKNAFLHYWDMMPATVDMLEGGDGRGGDSGSEDEKEAAESKYSEQQNRDGGGKKGGQRGGTGGGHPRGGVLAALKKRFMENKKANKKSQNNRNQGRQNKYPVDMEDIPALFPVNSEVLVQVTKGPIGSKGARVTTNLSVPGRFLVLLPNSTHVGVSKRIANRKERDRLRQILKRLGLPKGMGIICRTAGEGRSERVFRQDTELLLAEWRKAEETVKNKKAPCCVYQEPNVAERSLRDYLTEDVDEIVTDAEDIHEKAMEMTRRLKQDKRVKNRLYSGTQPLFEKYRLHNQIDNLFRRRVPLPSGGHICIDETEALIAIDVNTGKSRGGKDHPETILHTNLEAVEEIARQIRIRNLGGLIVLDLIDMRSRADRQTVYKALRDAFAKDRARSRILPISSLGLVEMTRQREHESLLETVYSSCPYCGGKGLVKSPKSISVEIQRRLQTLLRRKKNVQLRVTIHPHVLERLKNEDAPLLRELEEQFGGELSFRADAELHHEDFRIVDQVSGKQF